MVVSLTIRSSLPHLSLNLSASFPARSLSSSLSLLHPTLPRYQAHPVWIFLFSNEPSLYSNPYGNSLSFFGIPNWRILSIILYDKSSKSGLNRSETLCTGLSGVDLSMTTCTAEDFMNRNTEVTLQDANHWLAAKIGWPGYSFPIST